MKVTPFGAALGAEIECGDLRRIDADTGRLIRQAWLDHLVLRFRGQRLSDDELVAFTRHFGELKAPLTDAQRAVNVRALAHPDISVISNVVENGVAIGSLGDGEALWHTDYNFDERPYAAAMLHALEIPPAGGDTSWSNMYAAWDALPPDLRARLAGLTIKHDASYNAAGILRRGCSPVTDASAAPGPSHPIVRTHPETGRNCLYLGRRLNGYVNGLAIGESEALLDMLWAHAGQHRFVWRQRWRVGDLVVWDNRCTMHYREAFDPSSRRIMHKTQTVGERPFHSPAADGRPAHPRAAAATGA